MIRLLAADLVAPEAVLEGLEGMRPGLDEARASVAEAQERTLALARRAHLLEVNHRYAARLLALQEEWLEEAERVLGGGRAQEVLPE